MHGPPAVGYPMSPRRRHLVGLLMGSRAWRLPPASAGLFFFKAPYNFLVKLESHFELGWAYFRKQIILAERALDLPKRRLKYEK